MLKTAFEKLFQMREKASKARPGADEGYDAHEKPFLDHLEDLRHTLLKIVSTLAVSTVLCFSFHKKIFEFVQMPAKMPLAEISPGVSLWDKLELITLAPPEAIVLMLKLSFFTAVILSFPLIIYFLFQFILPGLRQVEKRAVIPGALVGFMLFLVGVAFAFFLAAPIALRFFYQFEAERFGNLDSDTQALEKPIAEMSLRGVDGVRFAPLKEEEENEEAETAEPESALTPELKREIDAYLRNSITTTETTNLALRYDESRGKIVILESKGKKSIYQIGQYITFIARLMLVFGISFQLPVVVSILVKLELLTARVMRSTRTYAWIIILVAAAILTPPDLFTLGLLGGPMIILYEICIIIATIMERSREKRERAEEKARQTRLEELYSKASGDLTEEERKELHRAEIEQYEREHAHLYEEESSHGDDEHTVARDSLHGDEHDPHADDPYHDQHDESWHADDHYWHDGHEDDPDLHDHHAEEDDHEPIQDWPDREEDGMESDHAEPVDMEPGEADDEEAHTSDEGDEKEEESDDSNPFHDEESCEPSGPLVDLNHATKEEMLTLPGINEEIAEGIMEQRPFETFADLERVEGLTDQMVNAMIDRLMLG